LDGVSHIDSPGDAIRDAWMSRHGIRVFRISNLEVLSNLEGMLIAIGAIAHGPLPNRPRPPPPNPLPRGEGE
jgi:very-short-patch-repair endonuclease